MKKNQKKYSCVALVAREHGLESIKYLIENDNLFEISAIFTHKLNPKIYDPERKIREDFLQFKNLAEENDIPFFTIDTKDEKYRLEEFLQEIEFDFLISISWRYVISSQIFRRASIGSFNIHRGDLPKYSGVEPIKKALENEEKKIFICSHIISEKIDQGEILHKIEHLANYNTKESIDEIVVRLKKEITPHFIHLTMKSLRTLLERHNEKR